ncbi:MAG: hypothetical protein IJW24_01515, partial [Clostridia bacterium]|nr:hypothetical protein [Clostridia bacterium]
ANGWDEGAIDRLRVDYKNDGRIGYEANLEASDEADGAIYVMCFYAQNKFVPILHGVDMGIKSNVVAFRSNYLESSYRGLVVGRGMIASADENNYGYPSVIASTYDSGKSNDGIDLDEAFYVHTTTSGKRYGAFVLEHDYGVTFNSDFAEKITADDDPNKGFYQLKKHNALLGVKGDAVSGYDCDASGNVTRLSNAAKERILKALPTSFTISLYEGTKFDENGLLLEENKVKEKTEYSILSFGEQSPPYLFWDKGGITISGSEMTIKLKQARTVGSSEDYAGMKIAVCVDLNALLEDGKLSYYFTCSNTYNEPFVMFVDESAEECLARMGQHLIENNKTQYETNNGRFGVVEGVVVDTHSSGKIYADTTDGVRIDDVSWQATSDFVTATSIVSNAKDATLQLNYASIVGKIERDDTELTGFSVGDGVSVLLEDENKIKFQIKDRGTNRNPVLSVEIDESGLLHYGISDFFEYREYVRKSEPAANGNYYVESTFAIEGLSSDNFNKYKDLGTVETLGGGNNHVWTVNVDYDKKMLWGNVVFQENLGESGFWGLRYDEDIEHLEHFLDSVHEDYEKHRIYVDGDGVLVKAYALVDFDLSTFNALSFLGVKGDGSSKVYTYDPDNDGSYAFYNKNGLFSTSFGEAGSDSVLQNKFGEIYEQSFTLSPEYIKFEDSFHVDRVEIENDAVLESGIYDKFNVTFSIFDRPWKDEDANHIVKVTSYYYIKVENSDSEQAVCPGVISADMLIELVRNDDKFVINSGTFTNLPVYSAEEAGELFSGKYSKKVSFVTTKVDKGFLGIKIDFKLWDSLLDFGGFRFHAETGTTNMPNQYVYHSYVDGKVAVNYSGLGIDFFGAEKSGYYSFNTFYVPHKFNFIVFVFAAIVIFNILFTSVWGLISRIYEIVVYFIVMPGVAAATTMDGGKMFKSWKDNLIKKVFASYGVILGLNLFFLLIPPLKEASQIFRDSDFVGMNMDWILWDYKAEFINQLIYLMFLLVAISMLKTLPATIAGLIGSGDVYKDGGDVKKNVKDTVDDVTTKIKDTVSGKALAGVVEKGFEYADSVKKNGFFMAPFKDKDGNWRGFVPGSAVYNEFKKHKKNKDEEKPDDATEQTEAPKEPTGVTPGGGTPEPLLDDNGNPIVTGAENGQDATGASETPTSALFDENGNPLGFEGESLAGDGTTTFNITDHPEFFDQAMQAVDGEFVDDNISKYFDLNEKLAEAEKSKAEAEANGNSDLVKFYQSRIDEINEEKISIAERYGAISENGMADDVAMSATRDRYNEFLESRALIVGRQAAADAERAVVDQINGEIETLESQREELAKRVQESDVSEQEKLALRIQMSQIYGEIIK